MSQTKRWCFTLNNYVPEDVDRLSKLGGTVEYIVFGKEVGDGGTPHLQGFVYLKRRQRLSTAKALIGDRCHLEPARGTNEQAADYCKKDGDFIEIGEVPGGTGTRTDLLAVGKAVANGESLAAIAESNPATWIKFHRGIISLKSVTEKAYEHSDVRGVWLVGSPGVGKSRTARECFPGAFLKSQNKWWCGYEGEAHVILDDLDGNLQGHSLKIWTDRYACTGETKGGTVNLKHKVFVVTSNSTIEDLWPEGPTAAALRRRCDVIFMTQLDPSLVVNDGLYDHVFTREQCVDYLKQKFN